MTFDDIIEEFSLIDDWEDKYRSIIELGRELAPLDEALHDEAHKVRGCASQVWLSSELAQQGGETVLRFRGDSDAHIVRGLIAVLIALYSDKPPQAILDLDARAELARIELDAALSPQRSNGLYSMVERMRADAAAALAQA